MAKRPVVEIDEGRCDGCGRCIPNCREGAIRIVGGKARLVSDVYCDGLGACLGHCPRDAISIVERDVAAFDPAAAERHLEEERAREAAAPRAAPALPCGCPGTAVRDLRGAERTRPAAPGGSPARASALRQWPVQLRLLPPDAPFLAGADLLLCADCVAVALPDLHARLLDGRAVAVACPKLDDTSSYVERVRAIVEAARPRSLTVAVMEVPCCQGLSRIAQEAVAASGQGIKVKRIVIGIDGTVKEE